ncbi:mechanosensitive ion channel protein MscS [Neiella marina]|uniref:Mechanosensitive ion channel protein MscS n=1 Tax=Neiella marina TaxID=508461 RepID=A0A8J2U861_9GAMM|nr:mechanosensitive ion channel family protein [Neiella marina]GGA85840.1 mechanosensitive ion channel protein MscS [Neiella marina]
MTETLIKLALSISLLIGIYLLRKVTFSYFLKGIEPSEQQHRASTIRNASSLLIVVLIGFIWLSELQNVALSLAAFMVAIVVATKEFLQCLLGFFVWSLNRQFRIGDWIDINGMAGQVVDVDWVKTTIQEVNLSGDYSYTGKTLYIPNNTLLLYPAKNLNFMRRYVMHSFSVVREANINIEPIIEPLRAELDQLVEPFRDTANRYSGFLHQRMDIEATQVDPSVSLSTTELGKNKLTITMFCPTEQVAELQQNATRTFLRLWHEMQPEESV